MAISSMVGDMGGEYFLHNLVDIIIFLVYIMYMRSNEYL